MIRTLALRAAALLLLPLWAGAPAAAQTLPAGFDLETLPGQWGGALGLVFLPSGDLLIHHQDGRVWLHHGASYQATPVIDLRDEVNKHGDRGLLGLAAHPGYAPDGGATSWIYLLYTVAPIPGQDTAYDHDDRYAFSRLTRYRTAQSGANVLALLETRQVLLGDVAPDGSAPLGIASLHESHSNGSLAFGADGTLLVATGDGAHFEVLDPGGLDDAGFDDWVHPVTGLVGPTPKAQDQGAFRAQSLDSLAGKVLRIDPETGLGLPSNPFFDGDPQSIRSRVWALGLRNPFRATLLPGTGASDPALGQPGTLAIGDVGNVTWEELELCAGGENFGWPCREGLAPQAEYAAYDPPGAEPPPCARAFAGTPVDPAVAFHHGLPEAYHPAGLHQAEDGTPLPGFTGVCVTGVAAYAGGGYPAEYAGRVFFADFGYGWIRTLELDAARRVVAIHPFAEGFGATTTLAVHPITGDLYVARVNQAAIQRIRYVDPDAVQTLGCGFNPAGSLAVAEPLAIGATASFALHNPLGTQAPGAATLLGISVAPDAAYPCGTAVPGLGMPGPFASGEILISAAPGKLFPAVRGPVWTGAPAAIALPVPHALALFGLTVYAQGAIVDPTFGGGAGAGVGLTEALALVIGS